MTKVINGIMVDGFKKGWRCKDLPPRPIPFDVDEYLSNGFADIGLPNGKSKRIAFTRGDDLFEFSYDGTQIKRPMKLYREWRNESLDMIMQLESYAIGECTRKVIEGYRLLD